MSTGEFSVSAAIPAYNEGSRIAQAIESILAQSQPPAEILVVDDGSTDDTAAIAASLGARVITQKNAGPAVARNRALREASAPWVAFCDADDRWLPGRLASTRAAHEARPDVDFIFCDYRLESGGVIYVESSFDAPEFAAALTARPAPDIAYFSRDRLAAGLARANFISTSGVAVRKAFVEEHGLFFDEKLVFKGEAMVPEDIEWYLRLLKCTDALGAGPVGVSHRRRANSLSAHEGHVFDGMLRLGDMVAATPERYAPGTHDALLAGRRRHLRSSAVGYARALQFNEAARRLSAAQRERFQKSDEVLRAAFVCASLPGASWAVRAARSGWRSALKPAIAALSRR